jgi:hypothetical protein
MAVMIKQVLFFFLLIPFFVQFANCQSANAYIRFTDTEHDFGTIEEKLGPVSYEFIFSNDGSLPLVISKVQPSCGCTSPEWTKEPVMPGKLGSINVRFDPKGRPGPFAKTITVVSNAKNRSVVLTIKGYVNVQHDPLSEFRYVIDVIRLKNIHAAMGTVLKGSIKKKNIEIVNASPDHPVRVSFGKVPAYISLKVIPKQLKPGEKGIIEIAYHSNKLDDWDYVINRLDVLINGNSVPDNIFTVTAVVREDFSKLTAEELNKAPRISFATEKINFGSIQPNEMIENEFVLKNIGKTNLEIRKVRASCGCTVAEPADKIIPPGGSTIIKTTFNSAGKSGRQKYAVTIITNDPKNYKKLLWLEGTVSKE